MKKKRWISLVLLVSLLASSVSAFAEDNGILDNSQTVVDTSVVSSEEEGVVISPADAQHPGETIQVKVNAAEGSQYKFVWQKDNWKEWEVIRDFSKEAEVQFTLDKVGDYKIYVDVKDSNGKVTTQTIDYVIRTNIWQYEGVETDLASPQQKYTVPITIKADVSGETDGLKYKYVWMKNNWKQWGVIKDFSDASSAKWYPDETGTYTLIVDVKDPDGITTSKKINYTITEVQWALDGIEITPEDAQKKGESIEIAAQVSGNTEGLKYKFVWMKDNWKSWGVIRDFSENSEVVWETPEQSGQYEIYVNVKGRDGEVRTLQTSYYLVSQIWQHDGVVINDGLPQQVYRNIPVKANVSGETDNLQYKFVWMKDNWSKWGVIQNYGSSNEANWYPKEAGTYYIYSDVKDPDGKVRTVIQEYTVQEAPWKVDAIEVEAEGSYFVGDNAEVTVKTSGETEGLKYKFVVRYGNDWSDWYVAQNFSENSTINVDIKKAGNYTIYVDIKDQEGQVFDAVTKVITGHTYLNASASPTKVTIGRSTVLSPNLSSKANGAQYKYVWMKNNWSEWGVISEFSSATSVEWTPPSEGTYYIYIDVDLNGIKKTQSVAVSVVKTKNGWYYENGYKFYYKDGVKVEDVRSIIGTQSSYEIKVNKQMSCVTVYAKDGSNGYIIPVVAFACSPGSGTPTGTFYTQNKYRWQHLYGADGQFCTRITGHVLFHSPPYSSFNNHTLWPKEYNKLGTWASAGCVRLRSGDAKWIYDNCGLGTKVTIYNSSVAGPFTKPVYAKIPLSQTWDPTDPYA